MRSWGGSLVRGPGPERNMAKHWSVNGSGEQADPPLLLTLRCFTWGRMDPFLSESCRSQESSGVLKGDPDLQREFFLNDLKVKGNLYTVKWGFYWLIGKLWKR